MNQIEREYQNALDEVRFSEAAKERMMNNLMDQKEQEQAPAGRGRFRPLRTGLIAACLCLALVGTAFAATAVYRLTVQTGEEEAWGNEYVTYDVYGEPAVHPLEDFSQKFQDDFAAWDHPSLLFHQKFGTWEEVTAYLGDNIPVVWHNMTSVDADEWPPEYYVEGYHEMYGDNKLQYVTVRDNGIILVSRLSSPESPFQLSFHTEMRIYTPDYRGESLIGEGWWKDGGEFQVLDSYTMANGCVAELVVGTKNDSYEDLDGTVQSYTTRSFIGTFMKDGILYKVDIYVPSSCPLDQAELEEQLHQVLDSFQ